MLNRRGFLQGSAAMAVVAAAGQAHSHHVVNEAPYEPPPAGAAAAGEPVTSGSGDFRYDYVPDKLALPPEVKMKNGHGLCRDTQGNIYFTFEPEHVAEQTRCLVRFAPDGTGPVLLGADNALAHGVPHGLNIHFEKDGRAVLYHANNDATVHKTTLEGEVLWTQKWSPQMGNYKPTDAAAAPGGDRLMVADGYGSSMIHVLKAADGIYAGKSWGGLGHAHGEFNCPHGITFDSRRGLLLTADRGNKRLEYFNLNGFYHSTIEAKEITAPCNADVWGDYLLVPDLDGPLVILDRDNHTASVIEVGRFMGHLGFRHPHDAIWLANGDIAACFWNPGRIAYFRKHAAS